MTGKRYEAEVESAKADFVPFQRWVSNPSSLRATIHVNPCC